ncbi:hypothetical protein K504DRAFT_374771 [Pleomassaria siparia CBS 279.74]|uniref:Hydrophobin n=1 Tax=Pleomassaria siparia CBS 279.74 TaxID=1314801 RepID=A0A6G1KFJ4_9PLEO|nr:hypothetical protein K504DRAFT_374771 [Pleomassaria siparia CBS 279.74]
MQYSTIFTIAFAAMAAAAPAQLAERQVPVCSGTTAQCCATDVLNLADLNCATPPSTPTNTTEFIDICSNIGQQAKCCLLPVLGQALVCSDVTPA